MRIQASDSFAVIVDCQERLMPAIDQHELLLSNVLKLVQGLQILEVPLLVPEQYSKGLGPTVAPLRALLGDFSPLAKTNFSAYSGDLAPQVDALGRKTAIVCGTEAHVCVLQTVIDLRAAGYEVFLVQDCIGSRKQADKDTAVLRAVAEGAFITSYESVLFELTFGKDHPAFRAISNLVK